VDLNTGRFGLDGQSDSRQMVAYSEVMGNDRIPTTLSGFGNLTTWNIFRALNLIDRFPYRYSMLRV
jgi:hypothetical protein